MFRRATLSCFFLVACAGQASPPAEYAPREAPPAATGTTEPAPLPAAPEPQAAPPAPAPPVQVIAGENTPIEGGAPTLTLRAPKNGALITSDKVEVTLALKGWPLSPDGNHVHLIIDNEPYIAVRDVEKPIDLRALMQKELGHDLVEGTHVLRAFPSRGHHESVKEPGAFVVATFHFKKKSGDNALDPKAALLTYSRPKGCVEVGQRALLDFYVSNTKLSAQDSRVRYTIDGALSGDIVSWTPHYIENLAEGEHSLRLQLVNAKGEPVAGPFNDTTRTIQVQPECKKPTPASAAAPATPPAAAAPAPATAAPGTSPAPTK